MISSFSAGSLNVGLACGPAVADIAPPIQKAQTSRPVFRADRVDTGQSLYGEYILGIRHEQAKCAI
jgi:hypothetical protein